METFDQSPLADDFVQNPYPAYAAARSRGPVLWWSQYDMPAAFDYATVNALLKDRRLGRERPASRRVPPRPHMAEFDAVDAHSMLELEPPRHTRLRGLVLRAFTSRRIAELRPEIAQICAELIADFPRDAPFDLIDAYCTALPVRVIARLLGVPEDMGPQLLAWSNAMVAVYQAGCDHEVECAASAAARAFSDYLRAHVDKRRRSPGDDLITHLIAAEEEGSKLSTDELISTCILLLNAGHEATVASLGSAVACLVDHATPAQALAPDHIQATVEELLRYDPPLHIFTRFAYADIDLPGHRLKPGDEIALVLGAACRDPAKWTRPDRFDPTRPVKAHAAFGGGIHFCVGAPLARLEMQVALPALFDARPDLRPVTPPRYADTYHFHKLEQLIIAP